MAGYSPARNIYLDGPVHKPNWFQRWRQRRRDKKADRARSWMKLLSGMILSPEERTQFWAYLDSQTTEQILAKPQSYPHYVDFCGTQNE